MDLQNYAHFFCSEVVRYLVDASIDHFFIGSGSRSTPLVSAIARNPNAKLFHGIDERCMGFMALGYGKQTRVPGIVVVTSGTAAANLYPSVVEAYLSSVPMLVITADRPFELRDCGANQTMFQPLMFANHILKSFDLAPPSPLVPIAQTLAIFRQAERIATGTRMGPVHINLQLREPLSNLPHPGESSFSQARSALSQFHTKLPSFVRPTKQIVDELFADDNGLLVVGELLPKTAQDSILDLSSRIGWPIFADVTSNLRFCDHPNIIHHFDLKLLNENFVKLLECRRIVKFGARVTSKRFWEWVTKLSGSRLVSVDETGDRIDPTGRFAHLACGSVNEFLRAILELLRSHKKTVDIAREDAIDRTIKAHLEISPNNESYFAARLVSQVSEPVNLFLSSGMPIRDTDQFARPTSVAIDVFVNRGASGIDGIMSTATGIAIGDQDQKPVFVLLGDMAFLHDTNGLMQLKLSERPIAIIVINNGGGGIFHFLPIASELDVITPYLDTPHSVALDRLCAAHDVPHVRVHTALEYDEVLRKFFAERTTMVVEVMIDRAQNVRLHKDLYQQIRNKLLQ